MSSSVEDFASLAVTGDPDRLTPAEVRAELRTWMVRHRDELSGLASLGRDTNEVFDALSRLQRLLYDAGWIRLGWPVELGGIGGSIVLRAVVCEELAAAGYPPPFSFGTQEVLGPAVARFAPLLLRRCFPGSCAARRRGARASPSPARGSRVLP